MLSTLIHLCITCVVTELSRAVTSFTSTCAAASAEARQQLVAQVRRSSTVCAGVACSRAVLEPVGERVVTNAGKCRYCLISWASESRRL